MVIAAAASGDIMCEGAPAPAAAAAATSASTKSSVLEEQYALLDAMMRDSGKSLVFSTLSSPRNEEEGSAAAAAADLAGGWLGGLAQSQSHHHPATEPWDTARSGLPDEGNHSETAEAAAAVDEWAVIEGNPVGLLSALSPPGFPPISSLDNNAAVLHGCTSHNALPNSSRFFLLGAGLPSFLFACPRSVIPSKTFLTTTITPPSPFFIREGKRKVIDD